MLNHNTGNALFLILIAVALFAALSYAITSSSRGGGNIAKEQAQLDASSLMQWYATAQAELQRLAIRNGIDPADVRITDGNTWTHCTTGADCLWAPEGGNVAYHPDIPSRIRTGVTDSLSDNYAGSGSAAGFTQSSTLLLFGFNQEFCEAYQQFLDLPPPGTTSADTTGEYTACFYHSSNGSHVLKFVLYGEKT